MNERDNRQAVLAKLRPQVGAGPADGKVMEKRIFCIADGAPIQADMWQPLGYTHAGHTYPRAFIFTPETLWEWRADGELRHFSAGTILWRDEPDGRRYCLFRRRAYPIGCYTIPAGHIELDETPLGAALREAYEETRLGIINVQPFYSGEVEEGCRRGADYHIWHAYLCECVGEPHMSEEADIIGWYTQDEIINELPLIPACGILFEQLFGERPKHVRQEKGSIA
jgi:8-oxo-dGTP pyrophosphatase MutT (NUDIX family)